MGCMGQPSMSKSEYYNMKLAEGEMFEDYVYEHFREIWGIDIKSCNTYSEQINIGENYFGMEIKYDGLHKKTKRLFIEYQEKRRSENPDYIPSGVLRKDNSWLYLIGNFQVFYIFSVKDLRMALEAKDDRGNFKHIRKEINRKTSCGFLLQENEIQDYALRIIRTGNEIHS